MSNRSIGKSQASLSNTIHYYCINDAGLTPPKSLRNVIVELKRKKTIILSLGPSMYMVRHLRHFKEK